MDDRETDDGAARAVATLGRALRRELEANAKPKSSSPVLDADPLATARSAGLRYVSDARPGIQRRAVRGGFRYVSASGAPLRDQANLARIRALAIPPAWTDVWICPEPLGHIQATGRDAKGRKQYRYHALWRERRDEIKYGRMVAFGAALPKIRARAARDLATPGLSRAKVIAAVVHLLERTLIRIGNEEYARKNASFGLTTLRERHVKVVGQHLTFHFRGKSGKERLVDLDHPALASIVKRCQHLPGQELFHFRDHEGAVHPIESGDVNAYLREVAGDDFSAKDFRTWHGTLLAASLLAKLATAGRPTKQRVVETMKQVAARLGNTPTVCRKSYVHPLIVDTYLNGAFTRSFGASARRQESALLALLAASEAGTRRRTREQRR